MKKTIKFLSAILMVVLSSCVVSFAQVTTSGLHGVITEPSGEPAIGVAVVATHEPSGTVYGAVTNTEGSYFIQGMRPGGPYKVEFSSLGFQTVTYTDVVLQLAESSTINVALQDDAQMLNEVIVISQAASRFTADNTGAATNINSRQIESLPTVSRSINDVTRLSPYGGDGMSFAGADGRTANFTVDGANFNNNFGLSDKLPGGGSPISLDAIEELQVVISPYDVRQTNFIGGGVNAITKSGTNTWKASAYVYHRNEFMKGNTNYDGKSIEDVRAKDRNTNFGATLAGPIIKDKLFFFVMAEHSVIPTVVNRWRGSVDGKSDPDAYISRTTLADLETVSNFVKEKYGYDTGSWTAFPANESNTKVLAKLDWNITDQHHLSARYNYTVNTNWNSPNASSMDGGTRMSTARMSKNSMSFANSMYSMKNIVHSASLNLNSRISNELSNELLATFSILNDVRGTNSEEFPFIDIKKQEFNDKGEVKSEDNYMALGYELFTWNNAVHNNIVNVKDEVTYYGGRHKITAGLNYEWQLADNAYMRNGTGYYRYNSLDDFLTGAAPEVVCLTYGYDGEKAPAARVQFHKAGIYAQDEWSATDNFKLVYGLRIDGLFFDNKDLKTNDKILEIAYHPASKGGAETHIDTGKWPASSVTFSPRIGFSWDVLGDKSLKVRGGTGLFSGRLPLVFFTNMPTNGGIVQYQAQINSKSQDMNQFAGGLVTDANGKATTQALYDKLVSMGYPETYSPGVSKVPDAISAVDPKFKMPQVWKSSIAIDYQFPVSFPFSVTVEGIYNKTINGVCISDWSMLPIDGFARFNGADNRPIYPENFRTGTKAFVLENTNKGYGWSAVASLHIQPIKALDITASYTHTVSKEITGMPGSAAESAFTYVATSCGPNYIPLHNSQYVTPDRVVASLTYNDKGNNHFSLIYEARRGGYNYSYMTTNDMNGDGYNYDAIYIPTDKQVADGEFRFKSTDDAERFMAFVHHDKYLSKHQGQYAEAYSVYNPWLHRLDFSYKHDFVLKGKNCKNTLQLCFDIKNVLNLFNSKWGVAKTLNPAVFSGDKASILKYEGQDAEGYAVYSTPKGIDGNLQTFTPFSALSQCWYASIGLRYYFN